MMASSAVAWERTLLACPGFPGTASHSIVLFANKARWKRALSGVLTKTMNPKLAQFAHQKYLNLESYRKTGQPIRTPMWFAEENGLLYVYSLANAGKVKRVRHHPRVRVASCDMRGKLKGAWVEGEARIVDPAEAARGHQALNRKYGWLKRAGDLFSKLKKRERVVMAIQVD